MHQCVTLLIPRGHLKSSVTAGHVILSNWKKGFIFLQDNVKTITQRILNNNNMTSDSCFGTQFSAKA